LFDVAGGGNFLASSEARRCCGRCGDLFVAALQLGGGLGDQPHQLIDAQREDAEHQVADCAAFPRGLETCPMVEAFPSSFWDRE
jgi:hypothetical protein